MRFNRSIAVYGLLLTIWAGIVVWQVAEHRRVESAVRESLVNRAADIANATVLVIRSQSRFNVIGQRRLEAAMQELVMPRGGVLGVALLNTEDRVVVAAGEPIDFDAMREFERHGKIGARATPVLIRDLYPGEVDLVPIVFPEDRPTTAGQTRGGRDGRGQPPGERSGGRRDQQNDRDRDRDGSARGGEPPGGGGGPPPRRGGGWRGLWPEPPEEFLRNQRPVSMAVLLASDAYVTAVRNDIWLRAVLVLVAMAAVAGVGLAWNAMVRSTAMEARLIRASEVNAHLQELNLAAAGLAHETRNPLNIVRGHAQMIAKLDGNNPEVETRVRTIIEEVDRVTSRLNQFLDYSKPRQVKPMPTDLASVVRDVARTMQSDFEDKAIQFEIVGPEVVIEADEMLLRQVLFNLMLNAVQMVPHGGRVAVHIDRSGDGWAFEVVDNGPGVPPDARDQIFRPYFTTHAGGTGLGLAIVRQIVLAHQWDIHYIPAEGGGSRFRVSGLKGSPKVSR